MKPRTNRLLKDISRTQNKAIMIKSMAFFIGILGLVLYANETLNLLGILLMVLAISIFTYTHISTELKETILSGKLISNFFSAKR